MEGDRGCFPGDVRPVLSPASRREEDSFNGQSPEDELATAFDLNGNLVAAVERFGRLYKVFRRVHYGSVNPVYHIPPLDPSFRSRAALLHGHHDGSAGNL